jgi:hypothetical protein
MDIADERDAPAVVLNAAHLALAQWVRRVGGTGFPALRADPGLLALVDQHAAAVRDAVARPDGTITAMNLASYADGVCDAAGLRGWHLARELDAADWRIPGWPLLRLLAVCELARHLLPTP